VGHCRNLHRRICVLSGLCLTVTSSDIGDCGSGMRSNECHSNNQLVNDVISHYQQISQTVLISWLEL